MEVKEPEAAVRVHRLEGVLPVEAALHGATTAVRPRSSSGSKRMLAARFEQPHLKVGRGLSSLCTPNSATLKKCITSRLGLGLRPDSRLTGPLAQAPPSAR